MADMARAQAKKRVGGRLARPGLAYCGLVLVAAVLGYKAGKAGRVASVCQSIRPP